MSGDLQMMDDIYGHAPREWPSPHLHQIPLLLL